MNTRWVQVTIVTLIALAVVPFGFNAISGTLAQPLDPLVFRLFLGTSLMTWTTLVLLSVYLTFARHELSHFAWMSVAGVFGSFLLLNLVSVVIR